MSTKAEIFTRLNEVLEGEDFMDALDAIEHVIAMGIAGNSDSEENARKNFEASVNRQMKAVQYLLDPDSDDEPSAIVCRMQ